MRNEALVSFCVPVHNAEKYLEQTLQSLLNQEYISIEIICVNDHSTDNSLSILEKFKDKVQLIHSNERGAAAARNMAYQKSKGTFIVFFDADDLIPSNYVTSQLSHISSNNSAVVVCKWGRFYEKIEDFKEDPHIIKQDLPFYDWMVRYWTYNHHTTPPGRVLIPRHLIEGAGLWNAELTLNDDLEFFTRIFSRTEMIKYNDHTCFYYRSGIGGLSSKKAYKYQVSNKKSIGNSCSLALQLFPGDLKIQRACANMWQQFIYDNYPLNKDLVKYAQKQISELGGADFKFPAGGFTKKLSGLIGWKMTKYLKTITARNKSVVK